MIRDLQFYLNKFSITKNDILYIKEYLLDELTLKTSDCNGDIKERLYWIRNSVVEYPKCLSCRKDIKFNANNKLFYQYCNKSCSALSKETKEKQRLTNLLKYGTEHPFSSNLVKDKKNKTNLEKYGNIHPNKWGSDIFKQNMESKYGVDSISKVPELKNIHQKSAIDSKVKKYMENVFPLQIKASEKSQNITLISSHDEYKYQGFKLEWKCNSCSYNFKSSFRSARCKKCNPISNPEQLIFEYISSVCCGGIIQNDRTILYPYELDIYLPELNFAIEIDGIYWHSTKFLEKDAHFKKSKRCKDLGIKLLHITDHDIENNFDWYKAKIDRELGISKTKINSNECIKLEVDVYRAREFCELYQLADFQIGLHIGLFYEDCLVSMVSIKDSKIVNHCSRFGFDIFGWILKLTEDFKNLSVEIDFCTSYGTSFLENGFCFMEYTEPSIQTFKNIEIFDAGRMIFVKNMI